MYGGLYDYKAESTGDYFSEDKSYKAFCEKYKDSFPASVFLDKGETPLYTVYGEFTNNNFEIKNGAFKEGLGSLAMYYHDKSTDQRVYVKRVDGEGYSDRSYIENSATSMFYISTSTSQKTQKNYCVFASLTDDGMDEFEDLKEAIADYIKENCNDDKLKFVTEMELYIDKEDDFVSDQDKKETFNMPNEPIIIKSVTVKKY
jgi:cyclophilin family peptidyl-prolyl cis-trans isomerase